MSIREILTVLGMGREVIALVIGIVLVLSTLVEVSKIKVNPWSSLAKWFGKKVNAEVLKELSKVKTELSQTKETLDRHIVIDDERNADMHRAYILRFTMERLRGIKHTEEEYHEILYSIGYYEKYCGEHKDYPNNRAVLAIEYIQEDYKDRMKKRDFLCPVPEVVP